MARAKYNLFDELKKMSVSQNAYMDEWDIFQINDLGNVSGNCLCGHDIRYEYLIKNKVNSAETIIGSCCVTKIGLKLELRSKEQYLEYAYLCAKDEWEKRFVKNIQEKFKKMGFKNYSFSNSSCRITKNIKKEMALENMGREIC